MMNLQELLRQKELSIKRLEKEIEAIRTVMAMLTEESEHGTDGDLKQSVSAPAVTLSSASPIIGSYSAAAQNSRPETQKANRDWP